MDFHYLEYRLEKRFLKRFPCFISNPDDVEILSKEVITFLKEELQQANLELVKKSK